MSSRNLDDLLPVVAIKAKKFLALCAKEKLDILVTCTYRSNAEQTKLYAIGRTVPGRIVTKAQAGQSMHNYRCALDVVLLVHGKPMWDDAGEYADEWRRIGELGEKAGLEWAGRWETMRESAHFQYTGGLSLREIKQGKQII